MQTASNAGRALAQKYRQMNLPHEAQRTFEMALRDQRRDEILALDDRLTTRIEAIDCQLERGSRVLAEARSRRIHEWSDLIHDAMGFVAAVAIGGAGLVIAYHHILKIALF